IQLAEECPDIEVEIRSTGQTIGDAVGGLVGRLKLGRVGFEAGHLTVAQRDALAERMSAVDLVGTTGVVEQLRMVKDKHEIELLRRAVRVAEQAIGVMVASLRGELSELQVAHELENQIRLFGGSGCSFAPIVAVGERAALPHCPPGKKRIGEREFVLIDWGATYQGYRSDLTRVYVTGKISPKLRRIYKVVLQAQRRAIEAIRPGVSLEAVDAAARTVIEKAGFGKYFGHGLGHGIGLDIHESPRMAVGQKQTLSAGMVVTVEPGIYLPDWGGVRIEDDVLVTRRGHEVLSSVSKELDECVIS
ncbi:MAG: aminopeptidase P family protein, partial [Planctomycetales bacterium]|nr:aminopeptidase P family protein [Planctomycetales bacterium]